MALDHFRNVQNSRSFRDFWSLHLRSVVLLTLVALPRLSLGRPSEVESSVTPNVIDEECFTAGCNRTVASLVRSINASADPCENFFEFACGGFVRNTAFSEALGSVSVVNQMEEQLRRQINELLAEPQLDREPATFKKAKILYQSCINTTRLDALGFEPARKILAAVGGWPLLEGDAWDESKFDWQATTYKFVEMGLYGDYLFTFDIGVDITNTTRHTVGIDIPDLNLDLKALDELAAALRLNEYFHLVTVGAKMLHEAFSCTTNSTRLLSEALSVAQLEVELSRRTKSLEDRHNLTMGLNLMNMSALQQAYPYVSWPEYVGHMLPPGANLTDAETIVVTDPDYMVALGDILKSTPKRVLANYMVWRALEEHVLPYLNEEARAVFVRQDPERMGRSGRRWDECVKLVQQGMRMATSAMYVRRYSSEEARRKTREMVQDISKEMYHLLESVDWMDPRTRRAAMLKAEMMHYNVAYPDELLNDTTLDDFYQKVDLVEDSFLENTLALGKDAQRRSSTKFHTVVKKQDWTYITGVADIVNAFFAHGDNSLSIPAGLLQGAFFQDDRPQYMNYGGIGFAIGHEVSHGFDETGGLFNMNGMMENWWEKETKKLFDDKVRCIVEMYGNMKSTEINATVNGVLTQSENIADNAALKLAYRAYRRYTARHGPEPRVPLRVPVWGSGAHREPVKESESLRVPVRARREEGETRNLVLKPRQLFWVSFASVWCSIESPKELNRKLRTSAHLPGIHRVNGAVRNQEAFAADFHCPAGSPMNPVHKCQVW